MPLSPSNGSAETPDPLSSWWPISRSTILYYITSLRIVSQLDALAQPVAQVAHVVLEILEARDDETPVGECELFGAPFSAAGFIHLVARVLVEAHLANDGEVGFAELDFLFFGCHVMGRVTGTWV